MLTKNKSLPLWGMLVALLVVGAASPVQAALARNNGRTDAVTTFTLPMNEYQIAPNEYRGDGIDLNSQVCETVQGMDIDGDGNRELLAVTVTTAVNNLRLYEFEDDNSTPTLVWQTTTGSTYNVTNENNLRVIAVGDSDGDGKMEILAGFSDLAAETNDAVKIYEFDPTLNGGQLGLSNPDTTRTLDVGAIAPATSAGISGILVDDLDNDGNPEVIIGTMTGSRGLIVYESTGDNTYAAPIVQSLPTGAISDMVNHAADLDGDGVREFATIRTNTLMNVWSFNGTALVQEHESGTASGNSYNAMIALGDLDDNGTEEIIQTYATTSALKIYESSAANTYVSDEANGLFPHCGGPTSAPVSPVGFAKLTFNGRTALLFGSQVSGGAAGNGQGSSESLWIAYRKSGRLPGDFSAAAFEASIKLIECPEEPVWMTSFSEDGTLDGDDHTDIILGTRSATADDGEGDLLWIEAEAFTSPVELSGFNVE